MSDDLVKRLRDLGDHAALEPHMHHLAADRIEELEAKLAKAVEALEDAYQIISQCTWTTMRVNGQYVDRREVVQSYRTTLAELKGEK